MNRELYSTEKPPPSLARLCLQPQCYRAYLPPPPPPPSFLPSTSGLLCRSSSAAIALLGCAAAAAVRRLFSFIHVNRTLSDYKKSAAAAKFRLGGFLFLFTFFSSAHASTFCLARHLSGKHCLGHCSYKATSGKTITNRHDRVTIKLCNFGYVD